jgi:hypothetical protein
MPESLALCQPNLSNGEVQTIKAEKERVGRKYRKNAQEKEGST